MKKRYFNNGSLLGVALLLCFPLALFAQDIPEHDPGAEDGLIYFLRGKGNAGSAIPFSALVDGERICKLNNRRYSVHRIAPGLHVIQAQMRGARAHKNAEKVEIVVEAGGTYYVQVRVQETFATQDVTAVEITRNSALSLLRDDKLKPDPSCE